jgi:hypothetical protein
MRIRVPTTTFLFILLAVQPVLAAKPRAFIDEPEPPTPKSVQDRDPWKELAGELPPWPEDADLVEFELDQPSPFRYYIDGKNLTVGRDGVVRYTLVAESASGARNVSVEGLLCTARGQYKTYAYGTNGRFTPAPAGDWLDIKSLPGDDLHLELHQHFLCIPLAFRPRPVKDMIRAMQAPINSRQNSGFLPD